MVSLMTSFTICNRFKIQLLTLSLKVSVHHISLQFLNLCVGYLVTTELIFRICCITHRAQFLHESHYFSSLFSLRSNSHSLRSSSFSPLLLPYFNKKSCGFHLFSYAAPHFWNHLHNNVRTAPSHLSFRKNLKISLFNQAFPTWTISQFNLTHLAFDCNFC